MKHLTLTLTLATSLAMTGAALAGKPEHAGGPNKGGPHAAGGPPGHAGKGGGNGGQRAGSYSHDHHQGYSGGYYDGRDTRRYRDIRSVEGVVAAGLTAAVLHELLAPDYRRDTFHIGAQPLPPGIAKNLARGKPIPPGLARQRVPDHLLGHLPHVDGHDWIRVGTTLILVGIATGVIAEVIEDVFD